MNSPTSQLCNIGGREIAKRRWVGIAALIACIVIETAFVVADASRWWRLLLLPLLYVSILGFLQAHYKVCVRNAAMGICNFGSGNTSIEVGNERSALRGRGITIIVQAIAGALIITAVLVVLHV